LATTWLAAALAAAACDDGGTDGAGVDAGGVDAPGGRLDAAGGSDAGAGAHPMMTFFLTSTGSGEMGGNLGGLEGADAKCQQLAAAVGAGNKTWVAWLSVELGPGGQPVHARDRVGAIRRGG
jgi:hypothetical protein